MYCLKSEYRKEPIRAVDPTAIEQSSKVEIKRDKGMVDWVVRLGQEVLKNCAFNTDGGCIRTIAATGGGAFKTHSLVGPQNYFAEFAGGHLDYGKDGSKLVNVTVWPLITITVLELRGVVGLFKDNRNEERSKPFGGYQQAGYLKEDDELTLNTIDQENKESSERFELKDFASQINVDWSNGWGIVRTAINLAFKLQTESTC
ncbi:hypothetical protein BY996DRAFT_6486334 [Phakopsora pachyrhizi]|nr:hypothetical protein BY996DRAFT_6486334 [Phakopsora pachyrhizi]